MNITDFGNALLETGDLDPVYIMLHRARKEEAMSQRALHRWLVAYWCLYHSGAAAFLADSNDFWATLETAAINEGLKWPRGAERRHWRGENARQSQQHLSSAFIGPEEVVQYLANGEPRSFAGVSARAKKLVGFGPWIAFKVADMLDRVAGFPVDFTGADLSIYKEPAAASDLYLAQCDPNGYSVSMSKAGRLRLTITRLTSAFSSHKAPPLYDRPVNLQEVETIMCKWKSHMGGHYEVGKDTKELRHSLDCWGPLATRLKEFVP